MNFFMSCKPFCLAAVGGPESPPQSEVGTNFQRQQHDKVADRGSPARAVTANSPACTLHLWH
jgi:hypothetical protein